METRSLYLAAYDVADPKRLRAALDLVKGFSTGGQKSVHECFLTDGERARLLRDMAVVLKASDVDIRCCSRIMRTTLDIDDPVLREVKAIHEREGRSIGAVVSELLVEALASRRVSRGRRSFRWTSRPMRSLVDPTDKEAVYAVRP